MMLSSTVHSGDFAKHPVRVSRSNGFIRYYNFKKHLKGGETICHIEMEQDQQDKAPALDVAQEIAPGKAAGVVSAAAEEALVLDAALTEQAIARIRSVAGWKTKSNPCKPRCKASPNGWMHSRKSNLSQWAIHRDASGENHDPKHV